MIGLFVWVITAFRAATTGITYDEAVTYMTNSQALNGFLKLRFANNHPINSLLIYFSTYISGQSYNEFAIRFPALLAFGIYLFISYKLSRRLRFPYFPFSLLVLNYYLNEFFGLARGYGLAATFILLAMYVYSTNRKSEKKIILTLCILTLASATIYSTLVVIASFSLYIAFVEIGISKIWGFAKNNFIYLLLITFVCLYLAYSFSRVTADGLPLFGAYDRNFLKAIPLSFADMFTHSAVRKIILVLIGVIILIGGLISQIKHLEKIPFTVIILLNFLLTYLLAVVFQKPLPTARILLPIYPILVLAICENISLLADNLRVKLPSIVYVLALGITSILLLANYFTSININYTTDWKTNYPIRTSIYRSALGHIPYLNYLDDKSPVVVFYKRQIEEHYHIDFDDLFKTP
jgi:hypothetical protein